MAIGLFQMSLRSPVSQHALMRRETARVRTCLMTGNKPQLYRHHHLRRKSAYAGSAVTDDPIDHHLAELW